jgi:hypothetical protein
MILEPAFAVEVRYHKKQGNEKAFCLILLSLPVFSMGRNQL